MSLHGLTAHFFFAWNGIPLSGWTTVFLSKGIVVACGFLYSECQPIVPDGAASVWASPGRPGPGAETLGMCMLSDVDR